MHAILNDMCGRFVSASPPDQVAAFFGAHVDVESLGANHNVAPTQDVYGVVAARSSDADPAAPGAAPPARSLQAGHWGLVPAWAKERKVGNRMINARSETLATQHAFKAPFKHKRLLIPMDGFYEWRPGEPGGPVDAKGKPRKQPFFIHHRDGEPHAVAGLRAAWRDRAAEDDHPDAGEQWLHSATVVTTAANATMVSVHDRMPVLVPSSRWDEWLDPTNHDLDTLAELFDMSSDDSLVMHPVSSEVNNVRNNRPDLIDEVTPGADAAS